MGFTRKTEIKDISRTELGKIAKVLNQRSAWKKLMQTVPRELNHPENLNEGEQKYNSDHIKLIENASFNRNCDKSAALIFFEEWMTTGRIRPTLGHLLQLLIKCELFRAADYVAINCLSERAPQRPNKGPAAKVDISLPYVDDDVANPNPTELMNLNGPIQSKKIHEKQIIPFDATMNEIHMKRLPSVNKSVSNNVEVGVNDNIQYHQLSFTTQGAAQRPEENQFYPMNALNISPVRGNSTSLSLYDEPTTATHTNNIIPNVSLLNVQSYDLSSDLLDHTEGVIVPNLSIFLSNRADSRNLSNLQDYGEDMSVPNLSILNLSNCTDSRNLSNSNWQDYGEDMNLPNLSILHLTNSYHSIEERGLSENIPQ